METTQGTRPRHSSDQSVSLVLSDLPRLYRLPLDLSQIGVIRLPTDRQLAQAVQHLHADRVLLPDSLLVTPVT